MTARWSSCASIEVACAGCWIRAKNLSGPLQRETAPICRNSTSALNSCSTFR
jgi:hypothetical protein